MPAIDGNRPARRRRTPRADAPAAPSAAAPTAPTATAPSAADPTRRALRRVTGDATAERPASSSGARGLRPLAIQLRERDKRALDKDEIRAHVMIGGRLRQVSFEKDLPDAPATAPGAYRKVLERDVESAWSGALQERKRALSDLAAAPAAAPVTPEDGSVRVVAYHMGFGAMDQAGERFIEQMADIGRVEGFRVVVRVRAEDAEHMMKELARAERNNVTVVPVDAYHDIWSEDGGEVRRDRSIGVPAPMPDGMEAPAEILQARIERFSDKKAPSTNDSAKLFEFLTKHAPEAAFGVLGEVFARTQQKSFAGLATSSAQPLRVSFSAIEGGNMLVGTDKHGASIAFVGKDSFELTRRVLTKELGKRIPLSDDEVRAAIAKDVGLPPSQVHAIEQPGDYHLDVKMIPIAPGEMIVNDSLAAAATAEAWLRDDFAKQHKPSDDSYAAAKKDLEHNVKALHASAKRAAKGEALAQRDLEQAGVRVHRIGASFPGSAACAR